jgi:hypothetical protein
VNTSSASKPAAGPVLAWLLAISILLKLVFILYLGDRAYHDAFRAVHFGYLLDQGRLSIQHDTIVNKTFLGPMLWYAAYQRTGMAGLKLFNLLAFVVLLWLQYSLGRGRFGDRTVSLALVLFAFYIGTNRNVIAGEPDDMQAAVLFTGGVLVYLNTSRAFPAALLMGVGFLFKYSTAIFCIGFAFYLLTRKRWKDLGLAVLGMLLPFVALNAVDGMRSWQGLLKSLSEKMGHWPWPAVVRKMLSTGLLVSVALSFPAWWRSRDALRGLFFFVPTAFFLYVLFTRHAFPATFVMMQCLLFSSFLIAEFVLGWRRGVFGRRLLAIALLFAVLTSAETYLKVPRETIPCDRPWNLGLRKLVSPEPSWKTTADVFFDAPWCVELRRNRSSR